MKVIVFVADVTALSSFSQIIQILKASSLAMILFALLKFSAGDFDIRVNDANNIDL